MKNTAQNGFTLIELLVVIAVIGVLSAVIIQSVLYARQKSRDTTRKTQLTELRTAITHYYMDKGSYPIGGYFSSETNDLIPNNNGEWIPGLVTGGYISALPKDPLGGASTITICGAGWKRSYAYASTDGKHYKLLSHCAPEGTMSTADPFFDPVRPTWAWQVTDDPTATGIGSPY